MSFAKPQLIASLAADESVDEVSGLSWSLMEIQNREKCDFLMSFIRRVSVTCRVVVIDSKTISLGKLIACVGGLMNSCFVE